MPEKGAKNLVLVSRSGASTENAKKAIEEIKLKGVNVEVCRCDVSDKQSVEQQLVPLLSRLPPARGVVYGAMVLRVSTSTFDPKEPVINVTNRTLCLKSSASQITRL